MNIDDNPSRQKIEDLVKILKKTSVKKLVSTFSSVIPTLEDVECGNVRLSYITPNLLTVEVLF